MTIVQRRRARPQPNAMTLAEHLTELRRRVIICVVALCVTATVSWIFEPQILDFLTHPLCAITTTGRQVAKGGHCDLYVFGPIDALTFRIKISAYGGMFLAAPVVLWEFWRFITPGLHQRERHYAVPFLLSSMALFCGGAALAYFSFAHALAFLKSIGGPSLSPLYSASSYLSLLLAMIFIFGLAFEFPVILVSLELAGVVTPKRLGKWRRWAIVILVFAAAVLTPSGDPLSMFALAVPLYVFYEASILIGKLLRR